MTHFKHSKIIEDIRLLVKLLQKYHFESTGLIQLYPLHNLIGTTKTISYKYDVDDIIFNISKSGMKAKPAINKISVAIKICYSLENILSGDIDVFKDYSLQLYINGYANDSEKITNFFCWHLDKEENTNCNYAHPLYHFHAGGRNLGGMEIGDLLMISSPRIPHPPMDIILAIHFVVQNFIHIGDFEGKKKLLDDPDYQRIIERSQLRILDPYFHTFSNNSHKSFTPQILFPLYV